MRTSALALCLCLAAPVVAQEHQRAASGQLGTVNFATSCSAAARPDFARAMALLHSFEFVPAREAFNAAVQKDRP